MNISLLPFPDENCWRVEPFQPSEMESVDVLRPASAPFVCDDPNAPALILVPGLSMDARGFARQLQLGSIADIHTLQANNHAVAGESGLGHFARHVEQYILSKNLESRPGGLIIGGCSMGGAISLAICIRGRVKPKALILLGTFAHGKHLPIYQRWLAPLSGVIPLQFGKRIMRVLARPFHKSKRAFFQDLQGMTSGEIKRTRGYFGRAVPALARQNQLAEAAGLKIPTLVVHGTHDWVLPHKAGQELADTIPGAQFVSIERGGHLAFYTHAEQVNAEIAKFLLQQKQV